MVLAIRIKKKHFWKHDKINNNANQYCDSKCYLGLMLVNLYSMRRELQSQNCVDVCYGKTTVPIYLKFWHKFLLLSTTEIQKEKSLALKLTDWRPFKLQNSNGRGGLNFWATLFKFWKSTYLLKLLKWF